MPPHHMPASRTPGPRRHEVEGGLRILGRLFALVGCLDLRQLCRPLPFHHFGKAVDHHIEKTAEKQTNHAADNGIQPHFQHHYTT